MVTYQLALGPELDWLLDDTEEALLGTSVHQYTIANLYGDLVSYRDEADLPWFIGNQLKLIIPRQGGRPPYYPSPDIVIHATLGNVELSSLAFHRYGPVALAIEVASPATAYQHDLDTVDPEAKPKAYAQGGIPEYLVFDPTGNIIKELIRAWRTGPTGLYIPWLPDPATGRWQSALGISFAPQGVLLRVYAPDGTLIQTRAELAATLRAQQQQADAQAQELAALRAELRRLRGE
jgi:Uma2 family endonuclease